MVQRDRDGTQARRCRKVSRSKQSLSAPAHEIVPAGTLSAAAAAATAAELRDIYQWVDTVPFSKLKKRLNRDMSDAIMAAELVHHYHPKLVDLHNYSAQNSKHGRIRNWETLNRKVLAKLDLKLSDGDICSLAIGEVGSSEVLLRRLRDKTPVVKRLRALDAWSTRDTNDKALIYLRCKIFLEKNLFCIRSRVDALLHSFAREKQAHAVEGADRAVCVAQEFRFLRCLRSRSREDPRRILSKSQFRQKRLQSVQNGKRRELERTIRLKNVRLDALIEQLATHLVPPHSSSTDDNWTSSKTPSLT